MPLTKEEDSECITFLEAFLYFDAYFTVYQ